MATATRLSPSEAWRYRTLIAACLATPILVLLSQHLLPSGDNQGWRAGPFASFSAALPEVITTWRGPDGIVAANRLLKQHMDDLERQLEDASHLRATALPGASGLLASLGAGNESVYLGRDGWLVLRTGFDYLTGPSFLDSRILQRRRRNAPAWLSVPEPDPRPAILDFQRQLAARGIRLLLLPAPTKAMVHPESLTSDRTDGSNPSALLQNPSFAAFSAELEALGVPVYDPTPTMRAQRLASGDEQYLRTDSHWSPDAVDAVARELADRIRQLNLPFVRPPAAWQRQPATVEGIGDLQRTLQLPDWQRLLSPQDVSLQRVVSLRGRPWAADRLAEILILGDSFTNVFSDASLGWGRAAGLAEQLSYHLGRPVDRIAINAGGVAATRRRLAQELATGRNRLAGKKLVIWQFAIRELAVGDWQPIALDAGSSAAR